jgi:hypothetical protein
MLTYAGAYVSMRILKSGEHAAAAEAPHAPAQQYLSFCTRLYLLYWYKSTNTDEHALLIRSTACSSSVVFVLLYQ